MGELSGSDQPRRKLPLRTAFKLVAASPAIIAGAMLGAKVGFQEATKIKEGWFEHDGVRYFPLYEAHAIGPQNNLPEEADALFCEMNIKSNADNVTIYNLDAGILAMHLSRFRGEVIPNKKKLIDAATSHRLPIAVGDVRGNPAIEEKISIARIVRELGYVDKEDRSRFWSSLFLSVVSQLPDKVRKPLLWREAKKMSRRDFLKLAVNATATTALSLSGISLGTWSATDTEYFKGIIDNPNYPPGVAQLLSRLGSLASNIHPEDATVFVGDLFMAHKIVQVGDWMKEDKNLPMVAYNVGAGHDGIENMILLPQDIRRLLITNTHKQLVGHMKNEYGLYMATARIIQADDQGKYRDRGLLPDEKLMGMLGIEKPAG